MLFLEKTSSEVYKVLRNRFLSGKESVPKEHINNFDNNNLIYNAKIPQSTISKGHSFCIIRNLQRDEAKIVGFLLYSHISRSYYKRSKLIDINILPPNRGKGFGKEIVRLVVQESRQFGSLFLSLYVAKSNVIAINLYRKLGFIDGKKFQKGSYMLYLFKDTKII